MIALNHFYSKYGLGVAMYYSETESIESITPKSLRHALSEGLGNFRLQPVGYTEGQEEVDYCFVNTEKGGGAKNGVFLSPSVVSTDKLAGGLWKSIGKLIENILNDNYDYHKIDSISQGLAPSAGEFANRKKPKVTNFEQICSAITTITPHKPSITQMTGGKPVNFTILPDLSVSELLTFIELFKKMFDKKVKNSDLLKGKKKKGGFGRPKITRGNFPYAPYSSVLGVVGLLGAIGRWIKETDYDKEGQQVLDSLKNKPIYIVSYGDVRISSVNNYVVDLAKENKLSAIIDSLYYVNIYGDKPPRPNPQYDSTKYETFDLFASRFLQLFNRPAFNDFLSIRAEYPYTLEKLFETYFIKMEKIDIRIIESCRSLGKWFNQTAYFVAKAEVENAKDFDKVRKVKSKVLIEIESAVFSARRPDELIGHAITRAGRLSGMDAPNEAERFISAVASGEITLDVAKNLLMAFSRLRYSKTVEEDKHEDESKVESSFEENI